MVYPKHWKTLIIAGLASTVAACADSRDVLAPAVSSPTSGTPSGAPTSLSRLVLNCVATLSQGNQPAVTCVPAGPGGAARSGMASGGAARGTTAPAAASRVGANDIIIGQQNIDVYVALSGFSYTAGTGIFQFNATVKNLLNQPLGTTDGVHAMANQTRIFFYTLPAVTHGVGTVTVHNPDGFGFFTQSQPQPYYEYTSPIAPGATTAAKTWQLALTGSVTGFTFAVEVDAAIPAEKSIWRWVTLRQGLTSDSLTGVWTRSASDAYAVGVSNTLLEYNGTTWSAIPVASGGTSVTNYRAVSGVSGAPVATVWAVGDGGASLRDSAGTWTSVSTHVSNNLYGVWVASASNAFAVGSSATILHYTGGAWTAMSTPHGVGSALHGVWGSDSAHVWAVGEGGTIIFYNGSVWVQQTSGTGQSLLGVWGDAPTDIFAVGANGTILHYNGTSWSSQSSGSTARLSGVGGSTGTSVWAVGAGGTTLYYNGSTWSVVGPNTGIPLSAVTSTTSTPWAVGAEGSLLFYTGSAWQVSTQSGLSLNAVWASSATDVWVSTLGTVLHYDGANWTNAYVAPGDSMTAIWGTGATDTIYTVGASGDVGYFAAGKWTPIALGVDLFSVWGTSSTNIYGGGTGGLIGHYNGSSYSQINLPTSGTVQGIWGSGASNVFAATSAGTIYNYRGSNWASMTLPSGVKSLDAVAGSSSSDVYAAGTGGTIVHYTGSGNWTAMTSATGVTLRGLWADAPPSGYTADAYAVGDNGTVQHYNGTAWLNMPTPTSMVSLRGIFGTSTTNLYVVGDQGTVLLGTQ